MAALVLPQKQERNEFKTLEDILFLFFKTVAKQQARTIYSSPLCKTLDHLMLNLCHLIITVQKDADFNPKIQSCQFLQLFLLAWFVL